MKGLTSTQKVLLATNAVLWTVAATATDHFLFPACYSSGECYDGIKDLWPIEGFGRFQDDFSIEEWLVFAVGPWIVVYFLNKGKES